MFVGKGCTTFDRVEFMRSGIIAGVDLLASKLKDVLEDGVTNIIIGVEWTSEFNIVFISTLSVNNVKSSNVAVIGVVGFIVLLDIFVTISESFIVENDTI